VPVQTKARSASCYALKASVKNNVSQNCFPGMQTVKDLLQKKNVSQKKFKKTFYVLKNKFASAK